MPAMPQPLDYRNPFDRDRASAGGNRSVPAGTRAAIPIEFDRLLTTTDDHAAVRAIERDLGSAGIAFFSCSDGEPARRMMEIHVATTNFERAAQIASTIFARRAKIRKFPRPEIPPTHLRSGDWIDL